MKIHEILEYFETADIYSCDRTDGVLLYDLVIGVLRSYITKHNIDVTSNDVSVLYIVCIYNDMSPCHVLHQRAKDINAWGSCAEAPNLTDYALIVKACRDLIQSENLT